MSQWSSTKARIVYKALLKIGWTFLRQVGSHKKFTHPTYGNYTWLPRQRGDRPGDATRIAKKTGLKPNDL